MDIVVAFALKRAQGPRDIPTTRVGLADTSARMRQRWRMKKVDGLPSMDDFSDAMPSDMPVGDGVDPMFELNHNDFALPELAFSDQLPSLDLGWTGLDHLDSGKLLPAEHEPSDATTVVSMPEPECKRAKYDVLDSAADTLGMPSNVAPVTSLVSGDIVREAIKLTDTAQFQYPWEKGRLKRFFQGQSVLDSYKPRLQPSTSNFVKLSVNVSECIDLQTSLDVQPVVQDKAIYLKAVKVFSGGSYAEERETKWNDAISAWWELLSLDLEASEPGRAALREAPDDGLEAYGKEVLGACFAVRSPNTLLRRFYACKMYNDWCNSNEFQNWLPLKEQQLWKYLLDLKKCNSPPTRATSLIEAIRFGKFVLQLTGADEVLQCLRLKGLASQLYLKKKPWKPANLLSISEVASLHRTLHDDTACLTDRIMCGHMLHLLYSRSRWSDLLSLKNVYIDEQQMYLEAETTVHKGARNFDTKSKLLPIVCPVKGICEEEWACTYFRLRREAGLVEPSSNAGPMLPAPDRSGHQTWTDRYLTSQEGNAFLKHFFAGSFTESTGKRITTHSMKSTAISWCSKWGLGGEDRAVLARHQTAAQGSTALYSRDIITSALRRFDGVLAKIRQEMFHPDANRSGMVTPRPMTPTVAIPRTPTVAAGVSTHELPDNILEQKADPDLLEGIATPSDPEPGSAAKEELLEVKTEMEIPTFSLTPLIEIFDGDEVIHVVEDDVHMSSWLGDWNSDDSDDDSSDESTSSVESEDHLPEPSYERLGEASGSASGALYINPSSLIIHCTKTADKFRCGRKLSGTYVKVHHANGVRCGHCFP